MTIQIPLGLSIEFLMHYYERISTNVVVKIIIVVFEKAYTKLNLDYNKTKSMKKNLTTFIVLLIAFTSFGQVTCEKRIEIYLTEEYPSEKTYTLGEEVSFCYIQKI